MDVFATNDAAAFSLISGGGPLEGGTFDATYVSKGICANGGQLRSPQFINPATGATVTLTDAWVHFDYNTGNQSGNFLIAQLVNSSGVPVVRLMQTSNNAVRPEYWNGAAWVTTGTIYASGASGRATYDIHAVAGAAGSINLYYNNNLVSTITGLNAAVDNFAFLDIATSSVVPYHSQILVSDVNTIGAKVSSITPNANGANTAWANDYLNVVKSGWNDATFISSATLGDKETYGASDPFVQTGYAVSSVWFAVRARLGFASPVNIKPLIRIAGVDYAGGYNFAGAGLNSTTFGPAVAAFTLDPSGGAWGSANLNAAEYGFQSAA